MPSQVSNRRAACCTTLRFPPQLCGCLCAPPIHEMSASDNHTMQSDRHLLLNDIFGSESELSDAAEHAHDVKAEPVATTLQMVEQQEDVTMAEPTQLQDTSGSDPAQVTDAPSVPIASSSAAATVEPVPPPVLNLPRSSARDRVFACLDLLNCIVSHLDKRTLTRLARTSRALFTPAASHLWAELKSFGPLMCLLPAHVLLEDARYPLRNKKTIQHRHTVIILKEDLERWKLYSPLVKRLTLHGPSLLTGVPYSSILDRMPQDQSNYTVASILLRASRRLHPEQHLLPNLCQLHVFACVPSMHELLELLLSPMLSRFTLALSDRDDEETVLSLESLFESLRDRCQGLQAMFLPKPVPEAATEAFAGVLAKLPHLQQLQIYPHRGDLTILGKIGDISKHLHSLDIGDHGYSHEDLDDGESSNENNDGNSYDTRRQYSVDFQDLKPAHFEGLRDLTLRSTFAFAITFLETCTPKLIRFSLRAQLTSHESDLGDLMQAVTRTDTHYTLRHFSLILGGVASRTCWNALYRIQASRLVSFEFELESPQSIIKPADRILGNLTRAWQKLETFVFKVRSHGHRKRISCGGLSAVLHNCSRLQHFRVNALAKTQKSHGQQLPSDLSPDGSAKPHLFLSLLEVDYLERVDPVNLAKFLSFSAPNARMKGCASAGQVNQFMQVIADVQRVRDGRDALVIP
ncbi:hypothetical protein CALVIDRAFT_537654 [Calocera viscosa TUFC12733]|uniref:Uncharacterized protein n=1 Tax=Calocera viscosa (strain TUFC12733) TaxID=1330018 RepID=A0A167LVH5_CALVF|nr:hypothetical protein CALVIDRAFT_537654 [Calocera viscosa TUFC12733]